ncbi:hypothetical protein CRYUN_Cryun16bG0097400 [Craigia yunnanensis]
MAFKFRLAGKVAIITGGASGIGARTACLFHENSAKVVIADIHDNKGEALANMLGESASYVRCVLDRTLSSILDTTKSEIDQVIGVNLVGGLLRAKHAARVMVPQGKGCILFTASACTAIAGLLSGNGYAVSKYGVMGLTKNLAAELGQYGIGVNCISPYAVVTPMTLPNEAEVTNTKLSLAAMGNLKGEILKPEGVAHAALYLASDEANYVSGLNLAVDGGVSIVNPTIMRAFNLIQ